MNNLTGRTICPKMQKPERSAEKGVVWSDPMEWRE